MVFIRIGLTSSLFMRVRRPAAGVDACPLPRQHHYVIYHQQDHQDQVGPQAQQREPHGFHPHWSHLLSFHAGPETRCRRGRLPTTAPASLRDIPPAGPSRSGSDAGSAARTARCASSPWDPAPPYPPSFRTRRPADEPLRNGPFLFPTWFPGPSDLLSFPFSFPPQVVGPPTADGNRFGAVTCAARIRDKMNRTTIMVQFTQLF